MLKTMRLKMKTILWVTIIFVVPSFIAFYGFKRARRSQEAIYAGEIYGKKIATKEYMVSLRWVTGIALMQYGDKFESVSRYLNLEKQAWDNLLLNREAKKRGIHVSDGELKKWIRDFPSFQDEKKFSKTKYQQFLKYIMGMNPAQFEEGLRQTLAVSHMSESVTDGAEITDTEILDEYKMRREEMKVKYVLFSPENFKKGLTAADKEINEYFSANKKRFSVPEAVSAEYLLIDIDEKDKESGEEAADELSYNLRCGELSWEKQENIRKTEFFCRTDKIKDIPSSALFIKEAFSLEAEEISSPVTAQEGCYIIKLKKKKRSYIPSDIKEVESRVREEVLAEKARALAAEKAEEFCAVAKKVGLKKAATKSRAALKESGFFSRFAAIEDIGYAPQFNEAAFRLKSGDVSGVIPTPTGFYALSPKERKGIDETKFAEEKENFSKGLLERKKRMLYEEWFADLSKNAGAVRYKK